MLKIKSSHFLDEPNVAIDIRSRPVGEPNAQGEVLRHKMLNLLRLDSDDSESG